MKDTFEFFFNGIKEAIIRSYTLILISSIICTFCMTICIIAHFAIGFSMDNKDFLELVLPSLIIYIMLYASYKLRKTEK